MINRIRLMRNIGKFDSVDAGATLPLGRTTLIYSENGRGKTTIASILRSLSTGDPIPIAERTRLGAQNPPHVVIETDGQPHYVFQDNGWSRSMPEITIFDDQFVDQNVYSGLAVQPHHRQNLHEVILGTQTIALSRELKELVDRIEGHNQELRNRDRAIPAVSKGPFTIDQFCTLPPDTFIDQHIQEAEHSLAASQEQEAIRTTHHLDRLVLPGFDLDEIDHILNLGLSELDASVLAQMQGHFSTLGQEGEAWVAKGMGIVNRIEGPCPFCAQDLQGSRLINHYRTYFSGAYDTLKRNVTQLVAIINETHSEGAWALFERTVRIAIERRQFWFRFASMPELSIDTASIVRDWRASATAIINQLKAKQIAPLEAMRITDQTRRLTALYEEHRQLISTINLQLNDANHEIALVKERAAAGNAQLIANDLLRLKAIRSRHEPTIAALCEGFVREREAKTRSERQRDDLRQRLEEHRVSAFPAYQEAINLYLRRFNAGFRLENVTYSNTRGGPTCTYNVLINQTAVPIGDDDNREGRPSFRNTLSAGDRNTLALSFFFASLDQDPDLSRKVVVIDDPISSLDEQRALTTVQEIRRLTERAAQVFILSHNKRFLLHLWETIADRIAIEVVRDGIGSTVRSWDALGDSVTEHDMRYSRFQEFLTSNTGDLREVGKLIRLHLESFLRVACPEFKAGAMLGPFIGLCRQRLGGSSQILSQGRIDELEAIKEYANLFHHDTNHGRQPFQVTDGELRGFVVRTMTFCRP